MTLEDYERWVDRDPWGASARLDERLRLGRMLRRAEAHRAGRHERRNLWCPLCKEAS